MMKKPNKPFDMQNFLNKPFDMQNFLKKEIEIWKREISRVSRCIVLFLVFSSFQFMLLKILYWVFDVDVMKGSPVGLLSITSIISLTLSILCYVGIRKEDKEKREEEEKALKKARNQERNERRKREEHLFNVKRMCNKDELISLEKNEICIGMHILVVEYIKGQKYDEKRNVSANKTTLKYKYGQSLNQKGNWSYELEVTFVDDRVTAFKDL